MATNIEKGVPLPAKEARPELPLKDMNVGDSILIEGKMRRFFYWQANQLKPWRFISRTVTEAGRRLIRIWRVG